MKQVADISKEHYKTKVEPTLSERQKLVLEVIKHFGGCTSKEVAEFLDRPLNTLSGRFTELESKGEIEKSGERRDGCNVYKIVDKVSSIDENGQIGFL